MELAYQKKEDALNEQALSVNAVLGRLDKLERLKAEIEQKSKKNER